VAYALADQIEIIDLKMNLKVGTRYCG